MATSGNSDAVLLLTAHLSGSDDSGAKPLTTEEWWAFANWLKERNATLEYLLENVDEVLGDRSDPRGTPERIKRLLDRGSALGLAKDRWAQAGLWWLTSADDDYPVHLKKRLGQASPPVLYGCGHQKLLRSKGIAVVGSRAASERDLSWTQAFGEAVAGAGYSVVSGGAKGIDQAAMFGALDREGTVVGILADSLLRASSSKMYRSYLRSQNIVLVSPFNPEAGFTVGRAMQRNKYIYCLSDRALVVHSGIKGGTWEGAIENMKRQWVPIWVRQDSDGSPGNTALLSVHQAQGPPQEVIQQICVSDQSAASSGQIEDDSLYADTKVGAPPSGAGNVSEQPEYTRLQEQSSDLYGHFIQSLRERLANGSIKKSELENHYGLLKTQFDAWMNKAIEEKVVTKESRPGVLYSLNQQPEHTSPQAQEPSDSSGLYGHFIRSLQERLANGSIKKSELENHYGLKQSQFDAWMKRAIEEKVVTKESNPVVLSLNQQPEHTSPQAQEPSDSSGLYGHFIRSLQERLANGSIKKSELENHYGLKQSQFDAWMKRGVEENVVAESKPMMLSLNQQPEHISPQEPSGISDLYGHFIQSLQERLANGSIEKSELKNHYGLVNTQFNTWMKRAVEENVVAESKPMMLSLNQQPEHISPQEPSGISDLYGHFIQSLQERLANGSIEKSELKNHYGLVNTQFNTWMKRAVEEEQLPLPI